METGSAATPRTYLERLRDQADRGGVFMAADGPALRVADWDDVRRLLDVADAARAALRKWNGRGRAANDDAMEDLEAVLARLDRGASS